MTFCLLVVSMELLLYLLIFMEGGSVSTSIEHLGFSGTALDCVKHSSTTFSTATLQPASGLIDQVPKLVLDWPAQILIKQPIFPICASLFSRLQ